MDGVRIAPARLGELSPGQRRRAVALTAARCIFTIALVGAVYAIVPLHGYASSASSILRLVLGAVIFAAVMYGQVRRIGRSRLPELDAVHSIVLAVSVFVCVYASCYVAVSRLQPSSFSQHLDRVGSLYFTITTFGTVGYGDIAPTTHLARLLVSSQILLDLLFIAVTLRTVFGVSRRALSHRGLTAEVPARVGSPPTR